MTTFSVKVPGRAVDAVYEMLEESESKESVMLFNILQSAQSKVVGSGYQYTITATVEQWRLLREEFLYRFEMSGGNKNPYGIDPEELSYYLAEKQSCKTALDRIDKVLKK